MAKYTVEEEIRGVAEHMMEMTLQEWEAEVTAGITADDFLPIATKMVKYAARHAVR